MIFDHPFDCPDWTHEQILKFQEILVAESGRPITEKEAEKHLTDLYCFCRTILDI